MSTQEQEIVKILARIEADRRFDLKQWIDNNYRMIMLGCMVAELLMIAYLCVK